MRWMAPSCGTSPFYRFAFPRLIFNDRSREIDPGAITPPRIELALLKTFRRDAHVTRPLIIALSGALPQH